MIYDSTLVTVLLVALVAGDVLGLIKAESTRFISGLINIVVTPWVAILAYRHDWLWLEGAFTVLSITLLSKLINAANAMVVESKPVVKRR